MTSPWSARRLGLITGACEPDSLGYKTDYATLGRFFERQAILEDEMLTTSNLLNLLSISWGVSTMALAVLAMYRTGFSRKEDDSLFLDEDTRALMAGEQDAIVAKMDRLITPIKALAVVSLTLLVASVIVLLWVGYSSF
jgi:hypothetical protein